jgi:6-pyruvoyltetrahydropterin/6-carboxytetrahydropterin synthase
MSGELTTLEFHRGPLNFSAGHFTVFSKTEREDLHGHNYYLEAKVVARIIEPGLTCDYRLVKDKLAAYCRELNTKTLLPGRSPYVDIESDDNYTYACFNDERIPFLARDILILPLDNISLESLSRWFVERLCAQCDWVNEYGVEAIEIRVFNGLDHSATAAWSQQSR